MKKSLISGLLVTAVSANLFYPVSASSIDTQHEFIHTVTPQNEGIQNTMSNSIRTLGSQIPLIQAYGLVLLQQPEVKVETMTSLTNHQAFAKNNVKEWLDEYNPKLLDLNQEMMRFSSRFNTYYSKIYELSGELNDNPEAKASFSNAFGKLKGQVQMIQENMEYTSLELNRYNTLLIQDSENFAERADASIQFLQGPNGDIVQLRSEIKRIQDEIQEELTTILNRPQEIINGSISIGKQVFTITSTGAQTKTVDFVLIKNLSDELVNISDSQVTTAALNIKQKQQELIPLIQQLSETQIQATQITLIEDQVDGFTELINRQLTILDYLIQDWKALNNRMKEIEAALESNGDIDTAQLQTKLAQLKKLSDDINKQTNQFEDFVTNVKVQ
ncbi:MAG: HBL/NHE enterotoxin family protein [Bacillota bacterium]